MRSNRRALLGLGAGVLLAGTAGCVGLRTPAEDSSGTESGSGSTTEHDSHGDESDDDEHGSHGNESDEHHEEQAPEHHHQSLPAEPSTHAEVAMVSEGEEFHFEPHVVWVEPGGRVTWTLESGRHSATAYHPDNDRPRRVPEGAAAWDSGLLREQGATFEHGFDAAGVYDYFCVPHEALGMVGSVLVGRPEPHDRPGLSPPQSSLPQGAREALEQRNESVEKLLGSGDGDGDGDGDDHDD